MKTRIIQTKFWKDEKVHKLSLYGQHLFIYLLTCENINISGIFELPDVYLQIEAKLTPSQLAQAKKELQELGRVKFKDGWIKIANVDKYNRYRNSPDNEKAYQNEIALIPKEILEYLDSTVDSTVYSNNKSKIINNKSKIINNKSKDKFVLFITLFNKLANRGFKGDEKARRQFMARLKDGYTSDDFKKAISNALQDKYLQENSQYLTPEYITRADKLEKWLNFKKNDKKLNNLKDMTHGTTAN